ncbi:MAG: hypothetical protein ACTTKH_04835 [Treponema sp.]
MGVPVVIEKPRKEKLIFAGFNPPLPKVFPLNTTENIYKAKYKDSILVKINVDERLKIRGEDFIKLSLQAPKTWADIKQDVEKKISLKAEWSNLFEPKQDYGIYDYRLENLKGISLNGDYKIQSDITVYVMSNYIRFQIGSTILNNKEEHNVLLKCEGDKPRGIVIIPKEVERINRIAFALSKITEVDFSGATNLKAIENSAFLNA